MRTSLNPVLQYVHNADVITSEQGPWQPHGPCTTEIINNIFSIADMILKNVASWKLIVPNMNTWITRQDHQDHLCPCKDQQKSLAATSKRELLKAYETINARKLNKLLAWIYGWKINFLCWTVLWQSSYNDVSYLKVIFWVISMYDKNNNRNNKNNITIITMIIAVIIAIIIVIFIVIS